MIITPKEEYEKLSNGSDKKVKLKCDGCDKVTETTFNNYNNGQKRCKYSGKTYCKSCNGKHLGKLTVGRVPWNKNKNFPQASGENSKHWKGGRFISSDGYWMIYQGNNDKSIKWKNYKKEHFIIMEQKIGRTLYDNEVVHHIDLDKLNNRPDNLDIFSSEKDHRNSHLSLYRIAVKLLQTGYIFYEDGEYVANVKLRELLEHPEEDNQQPSLNSNILEGSETSSESYMDNNSTTSAGHHLVMI
jgi:hypothetical protein